MGAANLLDYFHNVHWLANTTATGGTLSRALTKEKFHFQNDAAAQRCFEVILLNIRYYSGDFDVAFFQLQQLFPLDTIANLKPKLFIER